LNEVARPAIHSLTHAFAVVWRCDENGNPFFWTTPVSRSLIRYIKGHAKTILWDDNTWNYWKKHKLDKVSLFKILKPFHSNNEKYQKAVDILLQFGLIDGAQLKQEGGANKLWGELLFEVNNKVRVCIADGMDSCSSFYWRSMLLLWPTTYTLWAIKEAWIANRILYILKFL
jgi:hypothetical protein